MPAPKPLEFEKRGNIACLQFNRPQVLNALDVEAADAFLKACEELSVSPEVRAIVVTGAGRAFMAGGDLASMRDDPVRSARSLIEPMHAGLQLLALGRAPVIAALHGVVAGAGLSIALNADLVMAAEGTKFNLAYANVGASCDLGASWGLPRIVGFRRALQIALLSDPFDVEQALAWGIVNWIVLEQSLESEAMAVAGRLAAGPTIAIGNIKKLMRASFDNALPQQLDSERDAFLACAATSDFKEGVSAFLERRPAAFSGC
jgi:2-(1,2-epoxy-1,2-dihydrophenyl)acetyl-CoA isomerase